MSRCASIIADIARRSSPDPRVAQRVMPIRTIAAAMIPGHGSLSILTPLLRLLLHNLDGTRRVCRYGGGDTPRHKPLQASEPACTNEERIGTPLLGFFKKYTFRIALSADDD